MTIDEQMILVAVKNQRRLWAAPRVILGTLSDAEGGVRPVVSETYSPAGTAS